jgi:CRP-like cAMP-binding protein
MSTIEQLTQSEFFFDFTSEELQSIVQSCREIEIGKNKYLVHEGESSKNFYLLLNGKAQIEIHHPERGPRILQSVQVGELVGWSWLFEPNIWVFDVKSVEKSKWLECSGQAFLQEMETNHEFGYKFMKKLARVMTERLKATRLQVLDIYGTSI